MSIVNLSQIAQALDAMMPELTPVPVGTIDFAHDVPEGWLECNGAAVSRTKYARLFKKIGTKYGAGDGSTTFNLPNLHHRVLEGTNTTNEVAKYQEAGLPDISGSFYDLLTTGSLTTMGTTWGAFSNRTVSENAVFKASTQVQTSSTGDGIEFKASSSNALFGKSATNQNSALRLLAIIKT